MEALLGVVSKWIALRHRELIRFISVVQIFKSGFTLLAGFALKIPIDPAPGKVPDSMTLGLALIVL